MSALELFRFLGEDLNRPPSPPKDILKRRKVSQGQPTTRYWPGKAPAYAKDADYSSDDSDSDIGTEAAQAALENDRRYSRYANVEESNISESRPTRRRVPADIISVDRQAEPAEECGSHDSLVPDRPASNRIEHTSDVVHSTLESSPPRSRAEIRSRAIAYRVEEESTIDDVKVDDDFLDEEEPSDSDSDSGTEQHADPLVDDTSNTFAKPVFVPKAHRMTLLEKQELEREAQRRLENERQRALERQKQSKELLVKTLVAEEAEREAEDPAFTVDDTDVMDEKEYELWKIRELKRAIRDRDERTAYERLAAEVERRRNMTEEERLLDNERIDSNKVQKAPRGKMRFLQKYYHKGAFFMDKLEDGSEPVYNRDYNAPTAEDCIDKSLMPKSMQVRRGMFGKMGQTKYTHLTAEDTTRFDMPWSTLPGKFTPAGTKEEFDRPSRKGHKSRSSS